MIRTGEQAADEARLECASPLRTVIDLSLQGQGLADERTIVEAKGLCHVWIPVMTEEFSPGTRRGHPVVVRVNAPVAFRIYDEWSGPDSKPKKQ